MFREKTDIKIIPSTAYKLTEYDNVYIVLKGYNKEWEKRVWWSEAKQKYFLRGKIIEWLVTSQDGQRVIRSYPLRGSVSFVDHRDWLMFSTSKWDKAKEEKIMHIHYSWIEHIVLDFNSLDWRK